LTPHTITPDGKTLFVANSNGDSVTPITIATLAVGTAISLAAGAHPQKLTISPDGKTLFVTTPGQNAVIPIDVATLTVGSVIPAVGSGPFGIAMTPDQSPIAQLSVTVGPIGQATSFDASASTVPVGTIVSYAWNFGDGSPIVTTTSPATTHVYTRGAASPPRSPRPTRPAPPRRRCSPARR
jgi:YVTN family beta-propeller protein